MKQTTFASLAFDRKEKQTRREKFLAEMEQAGLLAVIEPYYPKAGRPGLQPYPLATMQRLGTAQKRRKRKMSGIRSRVEHLFRVMKRPFGYAKVQYRGIAKNAAQVFTLIGPTHLYLQRHALMA